MPSLEDIRTLVKANADEIGASDFVYAFSNSKNCPVAVPANTFATQAELDAAVMGELQNEAVNTAIAEDPAATKDALDLVSADITDASFEPVVGVVPVWGPSLLLKALGLTTTGGATYTDDSFTLKSQPDNNLVSFSWPDGTADRSVLIPDLDGTLLYVSSTTGLIPGSYADDAAAAAANVPIGFPYHSSGTVKVRLS